METIESFVIRGKGRPLNPEEKRTFLIDSVRSEVARHKDVPVSSAEFRRAMRAVAALGEVYGGETTLMAVAELLEVRGR